MTRIIYIFIILVFLMQPLNVHAAAVDDGNKPGDSTNSGGCNWDEYLDVLSDQEQLPKNQCGKNPSEECKARQYIVVRDDPNPLDNGSRDASWGRYQFIPGTWASNVASEYPQCVRYRDVASLPPPMGSTKRAPNLPHAISETCWPVQDYAAKKYTQSNKEFAEKNNWCGLIGEDVAGKHVGPGHKTLTCKGTKSGILSALHNGGKSCEKIKRAGKTGSHLRSRMCKAEGIPIPDDCDPAKPTVSEKIIPPTKSEPAKLEYLPKAHFYNLSDTLKHVWVGGFQLMTSQLTTTMMHQVGIIGTFFDAKHQLETQRLLQQKYAQAHKDYHPSQQMCEIGTFVRNLADAEKRAQLTQIALTRAMLDRALSIGDSKTKAISSDEDSRLNSYINKFCSIKDNAKQNEQLCKESGDADQINADISYTSTIDTPLTLDIDLLDGGDPTKEEENIFAFLDYIFMHDRFPWNNGSKTILHNYIPAYQEMRSLIAMRSVAQNSFAHIIAEKSAGPDSAEVSAAPFIKALMREMLHKDNKSEDEIDKEIETLLGENPSYYAQMEILTKKIYQHPEFIVNLYDKPANVKRIRAAMTAIKVMQDRDIHDALLRREMLMSMLLELQLRQEQNNLTNTEIRKVLTQSIEAPSGSDVYGGGAANSFGVGTFNEESGGGGF